MPPAGGGDQGGIWEGGQAYPCGRAEKEHHLCEGTGGWYPGTSRGAEGKGKGSVSTQPEAHFVSSHMAATGHQWPRSTGNMAGGN